MATNERIAILLSDPENAVTYRWARDPAFVVLFLDYCFAVCNSDPERGREAARVALMIAPTSCDRVQALALLAQCDRAQGQCPTALAALHHAFIVAGSCAPCLADLDRRQAFVKRDLGDFAGAIADAGRSIERYTTLDSPGHDPHHNGLASAYMCRGQIHLRAGNTESAVRDMSRCLAF